MDKLEFEEVENILFKKVYTKVKDDIKVEEIRLYMTTVFTKQTLQKIERDVKNEGEVAASYTLFEDVKRKPSSFPYFVAVIKKTGQEDVYNVFIDEIKLFYKDNESRLNYVLGLIKKEEMELKCADNTAEGLLYEREQNQGCVTSALDQTLTAAPHSLPAVLGATSSSQQRQTERSSPVSMVCNISADSFTPQRDMDVEMATAPNCTTKNEDISLLPATVYNKLAMVFEEKINGIPRWEQVTDDSQELNITRKEQKDIEDKKRPGKAFLDLLATKGYTLTGLQNLMETFQMSRGLQILRDHLSGSKGVTGVDKIRCENAFAEINEANFQRGLSLSEGNNLNRPQVVHGADPCNSFNIPTSTEQNVPASSSSILPPQSSSSATVVAVSGSSAFKPIEPQPSSTPAIAGPSQAGGMNSSAYRRQSSEPSEHEMTESSSRLSLSSTEGEGSSANLRLSFTSIEKDEHSKLSGQTNTDSRRSLENDESKTTTAIPAVGDQTNLQSVLSPGTDLEKLRYDRENQVVAQGGPTVNLLTKTSEPSNVEADASSGPTVVDPSLSIK